MFMALLGIVSSASRPLGLSGSLSITSQLFWAPVIGSVERLKLLREVFKKTLEPLYGSQEAALGKIEKGKDRTCTLLLNGEQPVGVLVHKNALSDEFQAFGISNSLEIKSLFLVDPEKNSGNGIGSALLDKVIAVAKELHAKSIHVTVSEKVQDSCGFFAKKKFKLVKTFDSRYQAGVKEHLFQLCLDAGKTELQGIDLAKRQIEQLKPSEGAGKRKHAEGEESHHVKRRKKAIASQSPKSHPKQGSIDDWTQQFNAYTSSPQQEELAKSSFSSSSSSSSSSQSSSVERVPLGNIDISSIRFRGIRIKKIYLNMIKKGTKTIEGRIHKDIFASFKAGDGIRFFNGLEHSVKCLVTRVNTYKSFEKMLASENFKSLIPTASSSSAALKAYLKIPSYAEKSQKHGVVAIHVQNVESFQKGLNYKPRG
ncbi:MAG: hypothetical protein C5B45_01860 [Chlamydiae bacterium]|nr:MAG: hypothetical protein C5B45_01860 [Chlamydiota bacterium]